MWTSARVGQVTCWQASFMRVKCPRTMRTLTSSNPSRLFAFGHNLKNLKKLQWNISCSRCKQPGRKRKSNFRKSHTQNFQKKSKIYTVLCIEPSSVAPYPQSMAQNMPQSPKLYWYGGIFDDLVSYHILSNFVYRAIKLLNVRIVQWWDFSTDTCLLTIYCYQGHHQQHHAQHLDCPNPPCDCFQYTLKMWGSRILCNGMCSVPKSPVYRRVRLSRRAFEEKRLSNARIFVILPVLFAI